MTYKRTLVRDLQSVVEACLQRNSSRICAEGKQTEGKQTEERATCRSLNEHSLGDFEDTE